MRRRVEAVGLPHLQLVDGRGRGCSSGGAAPGVLAAVRHHYNVRIPSPGPGLPDRQRLAASSDRSSNALINKNYYSFLVFLSDLVGVGLAWWLAYLVRFMAVAYGPLEGALARIRPW